MVMLAAPRLQEDCQGRLLQGSHHLVSAPVPACGARPIPHNHHRDTGAVGGAGDSS